MRKQPFSKHIVYAVLSFICPIVAFFVTLAYQSVVNSSFRQSLGHDDGMAAAMMVFSEIAQIIFFTMIGCVIGIIFAVISLRLKRRFRSLGFMALVFNGLPFLLLLTFWIKGVLVGL
jgi:cell division protein FtsX